MITGTSQFIKDSAQIISTFKTGAAGELSLNHGIAYLGLLLRTIKDGSVYLSQSAYIRELIQMDIKGYPTGDKIVSPQLLKSTFRQWLGAMIWIHQARPDGGFIITSLATLLVESCLDASKARMWAQQYNKLVRFAQSRSRESAYIPLNQDIPPREKVRLSAKSRIVTFTDSGFGALSGDHCAESSLAVLEELISRDCTIECNGVTLYHRCAAIRRVIRPPLNAESHAAVTAAVTAIWFQVSLIEMDTRRFRISKISPPSEFHLPDPFEKPPTPESTKKFADPFLKLSLPVQIPSIDPAE